MNLLTPKQNEIYQGIKKYYNTYGYFPTIREICENQMITEREICEITGRSSTATIKDHLVKLEKKGFIVWGGNARKSKIIL